MSSLSTAVFEQSVMCSVTTIHSVNVLHFLLDLKEGADVLELVIFMSSHSTALKIALLHFGGSL